MANLNLKKMLDKILTLVTVPITPSTGSNYNSYGGCYYQKYLRFVRVHVGVSGLTNNSANLIGTMPSGLRPSHRVQGVGTAGSVGAYAMVEINELGAINCYPSGNTYAGVDVYYLI